MLTDYLSVMKTCCTVRITFFKTWSDASRGAGLDVTELIISVNRFCDDDWMCDLAFLH